MSFEVTCGQCSGRLTVEQAGVVVACPHCGAHLNIADPNVADAPAPAPQPVAEAPAPAPAEPAAVSAPAESQAPAESAFPGFDPSPQAESAPDFSGGIPGFDPGAPLPAAEPATDEAAPNLEAPQISAAPEVAVPQPAELAPAPAEFPGISTDTPVETAPQITPDPALVEPTPALPEQAPASAELAPAETGTFSPGPATTSATSAKPKGSVPKKVFLVVASYASAMTIAAVWLLMKVLNPTANTLENLPDLEPKRDSAGQIGLRLVPEEAPMPLGHELNLGDEQRFGNLKVTALRVTRGPLQFSHYDPEVTATRDPIPGVLKLWLKFENMSEDQSIAPLRSLVFRRDSTDIDNERANNFVCRLSEKKKDGEMLLVYDHVIAGDWDIRNMKVDEEIPPGGSLETFIPTTPDGVDALFGGDEPLVWRVHFRKGYSPKNFGVTTVFEVTFAEEDVAFDKPASDEKASNEKENA